MAKLHMKGRLLQILQTGGAKWDYELEEQLMSEYGLLGEYWQGTIRVTLADLSSGGLVQTLDEAIDSSRSHGKEKVLFKYDLTEFGRQRMSDTGLLVKEGVRT